MTTQGECEICGNLVGKLYCRGIPTFKEVDVSWIGVAACYSCQLSWIKRHTVTCRDCESKYVTVNIGVAKRCGDCASIYNKKVASVSSENWRTQGKGLLSDLKREQWVETLTHFNNACAYCGSAYAVIEHFTPVKMGGGTGINNCVPACQICNHRKKTIDGRAQKEELARRLGVPIARLIEIEQYLSRTPVRN
jgi:5-methylcytosine-specific restriction endonuclease McrA